MKEKEENWFLRAKAEADKGIPKNDRLTSVVIFLVCVFNVLYLAFHQIYSTGFFTSKFGLLEMVMLYGSWIAWIITSGLEGVFGQRFLSRLFDSFGGIFFIAVTTAWLVVIFPFDFTFFAYVLPNILRFLVQWISNDIAKIVMILYSIVMGIMTVYAPITYRILRINRARDTKASKLVHVNLITKILLILTTLNIFGNILNVVIWLVDPSSRALSLNGGLIASFIGKDGALMMASAIILFYAAVYAIAAFGLFSKSKWAPPMIIAVSIVDRVLALVIFQLSDGFLIWSVWKIVMISLTFYLLRKT